MKAKRIFIVFIIILSAVSVFYTWAQDVDEKGVSILARELKPSRNVIFQIWNEFDYRTVDYFEVVKSVDKERLVTNSPGYAGVLGSVRENTRSRW